MWQLPVLFIQCFYKTETALKIKVYELKQNKTNLLIQSYISSLFQLKTIVHDYICIFCKENHSTQKKMRQAPILLRLKSVIYTNEL